MIADGEDFARMLDIFPANFGDMDEPVLMDADIDKCPEIDDVADDAVEDHADRKVGYVENIRMQLRHRQGIADIAAGLFQLCYDVDDGWLSGGQLAGKLVDAVGFRSLAQTGKAGACDIIFAVPEFFRSGFLPFRRIPDECLCYRKFRPSRKL